MVTLAWLFGRNRILRIREVVRSSLGRFKSAALDCLNINVNSQSDA